MYTLFYNLESQPFEIKPDPSFLWLGGKYQHAYDTLRNGIFETEGFLLLTGGAGSGKTTLLKGLAESLGDDVEWAVVSDPKLERIDFYNAIARGFGIEKSFTSKVQFLIQFSHFLHKADEENKKVLLLVDDCHLLSEEKLEELRLLANIEKADKKLINILFSARSVFNEMLSQPQSRAVAQRVVRRAALEPLEVNETEAYIGHRLQVAGTKEKLFGVKAVQAVHLFTEGVPGRINSLCDCALTIGAQQKQKKIDTKLIQLAIQRLGASSGGGKSATFSDNNGNLAEPEDNFIQQDIPITPPFSGFNLEKDHRRLWPRYLLALVILLAAGSYWFTRPSPLVVEEEAVAVTTLPIQTVVPGSTPPAVSVLEESSSVINEKKAAALKTAILEKAYEAVEEGQPTTASASEAVQATQEEDGQALDVVSSEEEKAPVGVETVKEVTLEEESQVVAEFVPEVKTGVLVEQSSEVSSVEPPKIKAQESKVEVVQVEESLVIKQQKPRVEPEPVAPLEPKKVVLPLRPNSLQLTDRGRRRLDKFIAKLKLYPGATVFVKGYVSAKTNSPENIQLSVDRALSVQARMLAQGIDAEQVEVVGMGNQDQIASNDTREGRRKNRRVEILVISDGS